MLPPEQLDEKMATLQFPAFGAALTVLAQEHADYTVVKVLRRAVDITRSSSLPTSTWTPLKRGGGRGFPKTPPETPRDPPGDPLEILSGGSASPHPSLEGCDKCQTV